jgi:tetratricopeptide (TPR) repeat protein
MRALEAYIGFSMRGSTMNLACLSLAILLSQGLADEAYYSGIKEAFDPMYRLDYEGAIERITDLGRRFPEHPGPPLAQAVTLWVRELFRRQELDDLDRFISPGYFTSPTSRQMPEDDRKAFESFLEQSETLAQRILESHPGDLDARYYLGSAEAIRGAYAITVGRSKLDALRHGKKAYQYEKAILDDDPDYDDAYMTVGTYEYVLDNLPWYIKWVAVIAGYTGNERLGFEYLVRSAEKGRSVGIDARVLLMVLYVREHHYEYALRLARDLHQLFPENFLFHLNQGQILKKMGKTGEALDVYTAVERKAEEGAPNYQKLPLAAFRYSLGLELLGAARREEALARFERVAADPEAPRREGSLSRLKAGQILDLLGRREEALARYREVLKLEDAAGTHHEAERYIERPYRPGKGG